MARGHPFGWRTFRPRRRPTKKVADGVARRYAVEPSFLRRFRTPKWRQDGVPPTWARRASGSTLERPDRCYRKRDETVPGSTVGRVTTDDLGDGLVQHHRLELLTCDEPQGLARDLVRRALSGRAPEPQIDDAVVVACELVTNALQHTPGGPVRMDLDVYEETAVVWVHDAERNAEAVRVPEATRGSELLESGRGLYLVEVLAEKWFVRSADRGKAVVAVMALGNGRRTPTP
ncbi:ATP-binding protein [Streptomyces sp. NPDC088197]|uniref:ATP-binding protein n=1 Tax=Streptomyces sp. NPDC088197 TaxID=3365840 RepID=UPI0037FD537B